MGTQKQDPLIKEYKEIRGKLPGIFSVRGGGERKFHLTEGFFEGHRRTLNRTEMEAEIQELKAKVGLIGDEE